MRSPKKLTLILILPALLMSLIPVSGAILEKNNTTYIFNEQLDVLVVKNTTEISDATIDELYIFSNCSINNATVNNVTIYAPRVEIFGSKIDSMSTESSKVYVDNSTITFASFIGSEVDIVSTHIATLYAQYSYLKAHGNTIDTLKLRYTPALLVMNEITNLHLIESSVGASLNRFENVTAYRSYISKTEDYYFYTDGETGYIQQAGNCWLNADYNNSTAYIKVYDPINQTYYTLTESEALNCSKTYHLIENLGNLHPEIASLLEENYNKQSAQSTSQNTHSAQHTQKQDIVQDRGNTLNVVALVLVIGLALLAIAIVTRSGKKSQ